MIQSVKNVFEMDGIKFILFVSKNGLDHFKQKYSFKVPKYKWIPPGNASVRKQSLPEAPKEGGVRNKQCQIYVTYEYTKRQKDCLWKQGGDYILENGSLGFIETLHKQ